jgi:methylenetetrahydrofolate dehydrogenase (NADP+) / methenyltetrahydrofolate cyclohydrolase
VPCTPRGVLALMRRYEVPIAGRHAVVIGRSDIAGKPLAMMLGGRQCNATVTWCHRHTRGLDSLCREADILVPCVGADPTDRRFLISPCMVKPGACVIDVGFRRMADGSFAGDVDFEQVRRVAGWITPNPGGVGPMTVLALMQNVIDAARFRLGLPPSDYPV